MSQKTIRALYEGRLKTWAAARAPALRIAYQNVPFDPPADGKTYLRCFLLPADSDSEDLEGVHEAFFGVFQISIVTKSGTGTGEAGGIADELRTLFPNNLPLSKSAFTVFIRTPCSQGPAIQDSDIITIPVSFEYRADVI
ncbi:phage tail terminator-like protein [Pseudomonas sp. YH-1]|uniref:phage tail terminator-like protein n=1 Tax=Pseudomonas sp. YH-1 TaxID=3384787 RepID=UPI003F81ADA9